VSAEIANMPAAGFMINTLPRKVPVASRTRINVIVTGTAGAPTPGLDMVSEANSTPPRTGASWSTRG
jgi:hypothetical protein